MRGSIIETASPGTTDIKGNYPLEVQVQRHYHRNKYTLCRYILIIPRRMHNSQVTEVGRPSPS